MAGYGKACDGFATGQSSYAISANIVIDHADRTTVPDGYILSSSKLEIEDLSAGLGYVFDPKTRTSMTMRGSEKIYSFSSDDVVSSNSESISYRNATKVLDVTCGTGSAIFTQRYSVDLRNPAIGVPTTTYRAQISGLPTNKDVASGTYLTTLPIETFRTDVLDPARRSEAVVNAAPAVLTYDASSATIRGTLRTGGSEPLDLAIDIDTMRGTRFSGSITASNGAKGRITGGFYGVDGREIGFVTTFEKFGSHYVGAARGTRG